MRGAVLAAAVTVTLSACAGPVAEEPRTTGTATSPAAATPTAKTVVAICEEVTHRYEAPPDWYADEPIYVGNEMPVDEVGAWAQGQPGFEELWIDRDHNGWISLAFSQDAETRQADLRQRFPDVGAVVVPVDWTMDELHALQERVFEHFRGGGSFGSSIDVEQGIVSIDLPVLTDARLAEVTEAFGGERVCVSGADPATVPSPGPQPTEGAGWRLLGDEANVGDPYRTGIATDASSLVDLWDEIGLAADLPDVDFEREIVVWFGAVFGSSCPDLRLDDVVVDHDRSVLHAEIVLATPAVVCTSDANARAYVVAVERQRLPAGRFTIQLGAEDPTGGSPGERTVVDADLRAAGAVADADDISYDEPLPETDGNVSGDYVETGYPFTYRLDVACGVEWLGVLNDITWRAADAVRDVPDAWLHAVASDDTVLVEVTVEPGSPPTATATLDGHEIVYVPSDDAPPSCP